MQDLAACKEEGRAKVSSVEAESTKVHSTTSPQGQEALRGYINQLNADWSSIESDLDLADERLRSCLLQWKEHSDRLTRVKSQLKQMETASRQVDARATLEDKQHCLQQLRGLSADVAALEKEVYELTDAAEALAAVSSDARVSNAASLCENRHQALVQTLDEQVRRWEQVCADHQLFEEELHNCKEWVKDVASRLGALDNTDGDRVSLENKLLRLQVRLLTSKL